MNYCCTAAITATCAAVIAIIFNEINVSLNFIFLVGSTLIVSAVPPISFSILWDKCSEAAAITGAPTNGAVTVQSPMTAVNAIVHSV